MTSPIDRIRRFHPELTAIRRDLHAHPELSFTEERTSQLVAQYLRQLGIETHVVQLNAAGRVKISCMQRLDE